MTANEEQLRRGRQALDRLTRRAHGPRTARTWAYDTDAHDAADETAQTRKGGNR